MSSTVWWPSISMSPAARSVEVEHAVARERVEHVGQERDRRLDRPRAGAVEAEVDLDLRLLRVPLDRGGARHASLYQVGCDRTNDRHGHAHRGTFAQVLVLVAPVTLAAGVEGTRRSRATKPVVKKTPPPSPKKETEEDREEKRAPGRAGDRPRGQRVPADRAQGGQRARASSSRAIGTDAVVCAIDTDESRLLGPVACWKVDLASGALTYREPAPIPGRGLAVKLDGKCARGYCLPAGREAEGHDRAHGVERRRLEGRGARRRRRPPVRRRRQGARVQLLDPRRQGRDQRPDRDPLGRRRAVRRGHRRGAVLGGVGVQGRRHADRRDRGARQQGRQAAVDATAARSRSSTRPASASPSRGCRR